MPSSRADVALLAAYSPASDLCPDCVAASGKLCHRHERDVLPQLAVNVGWLKLMGEPRTEQRKRQRTDAPLPISDAGRAHQARKAAARKHATSKRRGYFGLALAILQKRPTRPAA